MAHSIASPTLERTGVSSPTSRARYTPVVRARKVLPDLSHLKAGPLARVVFLRSLSAMVSAGIQLDRALGYLAKQGDDPTMGIISQALADRVRSGQMLSTAMDKFPLAFSRLQVRLVQMGEKTGLLDRILGDLSTYEERERQTLLRVRSSLTYPAFTLVFAALLMIVVPPYMLKGIFQMIATSGVQPPALTRWVMAGTDLLRNPWFYTFLVFFFSALTYFGPRWLRKPGNRSLLFQGLDRIPALGRILKTVAVTRFARALGLQLECGMSPLTALRISAEVTDHPLLQSKIEPAIEGLKNGLTMQASLETAKFFPNLFLKMVQVGEESASLPDLLGRVADVYDLELETALEAFTALLEPMVMMAMGVLVGVFVVATMLPMAQLLQNL